MLTLSSSFYSFLAPSLNSRCRCLHHDRNSNDPSLHMADVLGILGFALHAAHKVYDLVQTVRDGPDAVQTLGKEASRVKGLLTLMLSAPTGDISSIQSNENSLVETLVENAKQLDASVQVFLAKATTQQQDGRPKVKKLRWILHAGEAEKLRDRKSVV